MIQCSLIRLLQSRLAFNPPMIQPCYFNYNQNDLKSNDNLNSVLVGNHFIIYSLMIIIRNLVCQGRHKGISMSKSGQLEPFPFGLFEPALRNCLRISTILPLRLPLPDQRNTVGHLTSPRFPFPIRSKIHLASQQIIPFWRINPIHFRSLVPFAFD